MTLINIIGQLLVGFVLFVAIETSVLFVCLRKHYSPAQLVFASIWLTLSTYPLFNFLLPILIGRSVLFYGLTAFTVPIAEFILFWVAFESDRKLTDRRVLRACVSIFVANFSSCTCAALLQLMGLSL